MLGLRASVPVRIEPYQNRPMRTNRAHQTVPMRDPRPIPCAYAKAANIDLPDNFRVATQAQQRIAIERAQQRAIGGPDNPQDLLFSRMNGRRIGSITRQLAGHTPGRIETTLALATVARPARDEGRDAILRSSPCATTRIHSSYDCRALIPAQTHCPVHHATIASANRTNISRTIGR